MWVDVYLGAVIDDVEGTTSEFVKNTYFNFPGFVEWQACPFKGMQCLICELMSLVLLTSLIFYFPCI